MREALNHDLLKDGIAMCTLQRDSYNQLFNARRTILDSATRHISRGNITNLSIYTVTALVYTPSSRPLFTLNRPLIHTPPPPSPPHTPA